MATNSTTAGSASASAPANVVVAVPLEELTYDTQVSEGDNSRVMYLIGQQIPLFPHFAKTFIGNCG